MNKVTRGRKNRVYKIGRSTGLTCGRLSRIHASTKQLVTLPMYNSELNIYHNLFKVLSAHAPLQRDFGTFGDSGSIVWIDGKERFGDENGEVYAIGMLIGGTSDYALVTPMTVLQEQLDVEITSMR